MIDIDDLEDPSDIEDAFESSTFNLLKSSMEALADNSDFGFVIMRFQKTATGWRLGALRQRCPSIVLLRTLKQKTETSSSQMELFINQVRFTFTKERLPPRLTRLMAQAKVNARKPLGPASSDSARLQPFPT